MFKTFRSIIRNTTLDILSLFAKPKNGIHILNGHFLSLDNKKTSEIFHNLIVQLINKGVILINIQDAVARIKKHEFQVDKCYVAFTFDDGFEECYIKIIPVLNKFNIKAAFFINPSFVNGDENYKRKFLSEIVFTNSDKKSMTWNQIKELHNQGHVIGSHTMDHYRLNSFDKNYEYQISEAKNVIEIKLNSPCNYFAYTYGKIQDFSIEALKIAESKYSYIFSQDDYRNYFSFGGKVINRRHFECDWKYKHVLYFLKSKKSGI
jgi:peptidoglycan/xylan/chitin deacetylase (PgdA/CDA1 family)